MSQHVQRPGGSFLLPGPIRPHPLLEKNLRTDCCGEKVDAPGDRFECLILSSPFRLPLLYPKQQQQQQQNTRPTNETSPLSGGLLMLRQTEEERLPEVRSHMPHLSIGEEGACPGIWVRYGHWNLHGASSHGTSYPRILQQWSSKTPRPPLNVWSGYSVIVRVSSAGKEPFPYFMDRKE